jgi:glycosyltransferase involved in cell wall biosynthesis
MRTTIVIPAWNEERRIADTLAGLQWVKRKYNAEIIVVDDGSRDKTAQQALRWTDRVIRHGRKMGKGRAMESGWRAADGDVVVFLDADLGATSCYAGRLIAPVSEQEADMAIAILPPAERKGGFGLVKGLASAGIARLSGYRTAAPLSGQRAVRRTVLERIGGLASGFGIEVGLTIDAVRHGYRIVEVEVPFRHRETGRDWRGFAHRGKQFVQVGMALLHKWRELV